MLKRTDIFDSFVPLSYIYTSIEGSRQLSLYTITIMAEQPTIIKQAEDAVSQVAASVAETLNFGDKEVVGNPGKLVAPSTDPS